MRRQGCLWWSCSCPRQAGHLGAARPTRAAAVIAAADAAAADFLAAAGAAATAAAAATALWLQDLQEYLTGRSDRSEFINLTVPDLEVSRAAGAAGQPA